MFLDKTPLPLLECLSFQRCVPDMSKHIEKAPDHRRSGDFFLAAELGFEPRQYESES
jgi:hypothetical protein